MSNERFGFVEEKSWKEQLHKSNLILQILLFSNVYISTLWTVCCGYYLIYNVFSFGKIQIILTLMSYVLTVPAEILRLYLGYSGNLKGKISDLGAFWILTTLIQLPIHSYLTYTTENVIILLILQYLMLFWLIIEIPVGAYASRILSMYQAQLYHIRLISKSRQQDTY